MATSIRARYVRSRTEKTYDVFIFDETIFTIVTYHPAPVTTWISAVETLRRQNHHRLIVGFKVEWSPSFDLDPDKRNPIGTLQLCVGRRCLIYQIFHGLSQRLPRSLVDFLSDPNNIFVGVGIKSDLEKLQDDYRIAGNMSHVDLGGLAAGRLNRPELKNAGLRELANVVVGRDVEKPLVATMSTVWDDLELTEEQVLYATIDPFVSFEIGRILNAAD